MEEDSRLPLRSNTAAVAFDFEPQYADLPRQGSLTPTKAAEKPKPAKPKSGGLMGCFGPGAADASPPQADRRPPAANAAQPSRVQLDGWALSYVRPNGKR
jgi:hypothetical protein